MTGSLLKILPVLDLLGGWVVQGKSGNRKVYQPIRSELCPTAVPVEVADVFCEAFGFREFYVADLDAIESQQPQEHFLTQLVSAGYSLHLDAGVNSLAQIKHWLDLGVENVILGLESCPDRKFLKQAVQQFTAEQLTFSLDLKLSRPLTDIPEWKEMPPAEIAAEVIGYGYRNLILLDLLPVGRDRGVTTLPLTSQLRTAFPAVNLITGGGVRGLPDLKAIRNAGANGALVSTAFHNGKLTPDNLPPLMQGPQ